MGEGEGAMSDGTHIQWTDASWNPVRARRKDGLPNKAGGGHSCLRMSPGCSNCYAATINKRLGTGLDYDVKGLAASAPYLDERALMAPLRARKPKRWFLSSMTDVFGEWVPDEWLDRIFAVMALSPQHTFQVLTKRSGRMREYLSEYMTERRVQEEAWNSGGARAGLVIEMRWPLPNVWLGVSVEDQERADERIPELR